MQRTVLYALAFVFGGAVVAAYYERPSRPHGAVTIVYPLREVTHPGTGETQTVFRTVHLAPAPSDAAPVWRINRARYVVLPDD